MIPGRNNLDERIRNLAQKNHDYIAKDNPDAAKSTVDEIYEKAQILTEFPRAGYQYEESNKTIRILLYGHYRIAYWIKSGEQIDILGVFHGAMEIDRYLD